ncbi:MAG: hypothetical protein ACRDDY_04435 [Clostridium sp.]|uniref:hypothetical protein n=1 Tax=Clostridium sp. TaxID=1506 RepID=UPI003EE52EBD
MKKLNKGLIFGVFIVLLALTLGMVIVKGNISSQKYEIVTTNNTINESQEQLNSVVEVITKATYQNVKSLKNEKEKGYVVVADKDITEGEINAIINIGKGLNIKISFLENEAVNKNSRIQQSGDTVIPNGVDLNRALEESKIDALNLNQLYTFKSDDKKSMVVFIENVKELEKHKGEFNEKIDDLKAEGYKFRAFS